MPLSKSGHLEMCLQWDQVHEFPVDLDGQVTIDRGLSTT